MSATDQRRRLALGPDEAAAALGVSRDLFDKHILPDLHHVRRGRRILIAAHELETWLQRASRCPPGRAES
jgi:ABC-type cobalamin transport system ATPase subunit